MSEESQTNKPVATAQQLAARRYAAAAAGRFELRGELGSGSSGTVHHARLLRPYGELPTGHEVAIKFLRVDLPADERALERFRSEGELGRKLRHRNLAMIHGIETVATDAGEVTYLVMQFVAGTTLRGFLAETHRAVEDLSRRIGADAALGLHALHQKGFVHRDVKPENLILTPESELKIVDLGLVRPFGTGRGGSGSSVTSGFGLAGSVAYAAPESLRGERAGPRSDLYSLGVVLYEVTTGEHPFTDCVTADAMIDAHLNREPQPAAHLRPSVSPLLARILADLLRKDPDRRPRDAAELARILRQGEGSDYWRRLETHEPVQASRRRLLRMRRPAEVPFVGRRKERVRLGRALAAAHAGTGAVLVVHGPRGIGRRRLCDHMMEQWLETNQPPLLLGGEADRELGHAEPFAGALLDLLLRGDERTTPQAEARAISAAQALLELGPDDATATAAVALGTSSEAPEVRADRLATALIRLASPRRPIVIRVDHAEQLDTSGRLVLQRLQNAITTTALLLLLTTESDQVTGTERLELIGLAEREFLAFGRALFADAAVADAEFADNFLLTAHQTFGGVPGHFTEALDHLVNTGRLRGRPGNYHDLQPGTDLDPAPDHLDRFAQRIRSLEPEQRDVLSAAAVLGRRCQLADLVHLTGRPELAVLETLSLFRGRIVRAQAGEVWFRHRQFVRVLLENIPPRRRSELHLEAATWLRRQDAGPLAIGLHHSQALDHAGALEPLLDGLEELVQSSSRRTALRIAGRLAVHFRHVQQSPSSNRLRLRFLLLQAEARKNNGQPAAAIKSYRGAEQLARELGDIESSAAARVGIAARELSNGHLLAAIAMLEAVHDDLRGTTGSRGERIAASAHGLHGRILLYQGDAADGHRHLQAALALLDPTDDELRCQLRIDLARLEALQHHYPTALKTLQRVDKDPGARHLPRVRLRLNLYRGHTRLLLGDEDAVQDLRAAIDEAERLALPAYGGRAELYLGERQFWRERDADARAHFGRARELAIAGNDRLGEAMARCYLARLGADDADLPALVDRLAMPAVQANWLLAGAAGGALPPAAREMLEALARSQDLPLFQHLRILLLVERPASARSLVRTIAERIPERRARRRFRRLWPDGARI
ncbi:MAG: protein kinase [bacterium]|nr:protein kinase [bacterium]